MDSSRPPTYDNPKERRRPFRQRLKEGSARHDAQALNQVPDAAEGNFLNHPTAPKTQPEAATPKDLGCPSVNQEASPGES